MRSAPAAATRPKRQVLRMKQGHEPLPFVLSRALLRAHYFEFFTDFARVLLPPLQINK